MTVRIAVIGCGSWGINHVRSARKLRNAELVRVCDADPRTRARALEVAPNAKGTADAAEVFADPNVDAVIIAAPAPTHAALARAALSAGKHILVEKPFVLDPSEGEPLVAMAAERGNVLMVGHLLRYHPYFRRLERMVKDGDLGDVRYGYSIRVNLGVVRSDENAFWSLAPHDISMLCALMGAEPTEISATGQSFLQAGVEDVVFATIRFANDTIAHIHTSWLDPHKHRRITVVGSKKMATFDDMEPAEKLKIYDKGVEAKDDDGRVSVSFERFHTLRQGDIYLPSIPMVEPLVAEQQHFVDCIVEGRTPETDGREAMRVVRCLVAASESLAAGGKPVHI